MSTFLKQILPENIGIPLLCPVPTPQEEKEAIEILEFMKKKLVENETVRGRNNKARAAKELFDYIIDREIFKNPKFSHCLKLQATVWNKLVDFQHECIPGPDDPKVWVPIAAEKLFFLSHICQSTGKTSAIEWNVIP